MRKIALITSKDPKGRHILGLCEAGLNKAKLDDRKGQRLIERGDKFQDGLLRLFAELTVSDLYANEEVPSSYGYPTAYAVKSLENQIAALKRAFPELRTASAIAFVEETLPELLLPEWAEEWFAFAWWEKIASTYGQALERMFGVIASTRKFTNYRGGKLDPEYLRQSAQAIAAWEEIRATQHGDILIVPAQFGKRHAGRSVRRAREVFLGNEFGLGSFAVACMLLTHPERLVSYDDLWIDCAGDEYSPGADGRFGRAPYFYFHDGKVEFDTHWLVDAYEFYGSASAFLPQ